MDKLNLPENVDPLSEILLQCLHPDRDRFPHNRLKKFKTEEWKSFVELAVEHRVVPLLHERLIDTGVLHSTDQDGGAHRALEYYARQVAKLNLKFFGELRAFLEKCSQNQIQVILLKGICLANQVYKNPGIREMYDIDLLLKPADLEQSYHLLTEMGYRSENPVQIENIENVIRQHHHIEALVKEDFAVFELHWNITPPGNVCNINPEELWARAEPLTIAGEKAYALCREDLLIHLCIHTSYQHNFLIGLRPFIDIAEVIDKEKERIDWDFFTERARRFECERGVFMALKISQALMGASVPGRVLKKLQPDDTEPEIMETAVELIFTKKAESRLLSPAMVNFAKDSSLSGRGKLIFNRIFWPQHVMVKYYPVREGSLKLYLYYFVRFWDAFKRNAGSILKVFSKKKDVRNIIDRKEKLQNWMKV